MPTMLDATRRWRETWARTKAGVRSSGPWRVLVAGLIVIGGGLFLLALAVAAIAASAVLTISSLNQLFDLGIDPLDGWNLSAVAWLWFLLYTLAVNARSKPARKEEKR